MIEEGHCIFCNLSLKDGFPLGKTFQISPDCREITDNSIPAKLPSHLSFDGGSELTFKSLLLKNVGFPKDIPQTVEKLVENNSGNFTAHWSCLFWASGITLIKSEETEKTPASLNFKFSKIDGIYSCVAQSLKTVCIFCGRLGASMKCSQAGCQRTFHYPCFIELGTNLSCILDINENIKPICLCLNHKKQLDGCGLPLLFCWICNGPIEAFDSLICDSCGRHAHVQCISPPISTIFGSKLSWSCIECRRCAVCSEACKNKNFNCKKCFRYFHSNCVEDDSQSTFLCPLCDVINSCQQDDSRKNQVAEKSSKKTFDFSAGKCPQKSRRHDSSHSRPNLKNNRRKTQKSQKINKDDQDLGKIIIYSHKNDFYTNQDICSLCGSIGKDKESAMIICSHCGQSFHTYCVDLPEHYSDWRCLDCTVCVVCNEADNETSLLMCDDCNKTYHTYCLSPPLNSVPDGVWKCTRCALCQHCGSLGAFYNEYSSCQACYSQSSYICCSEPTQDGQLLIKCGQCQRWLHAGCDDIRTETEAEIATNIGYTCPKCRQSSDSPLVAIIDGVCLTERGMELFHGNKLTEIKCSPKEEVMGEQGRQKSKKSRRSSPEESKMPKKSRKNVNFEEYFPPFIKEEFFAEEPTNIIDCLKKRKESNTNLKFPTKQEFEDVYDQIAEQIEKQYPPSPLSQELERYPTEFMHKIDEFYENIPESEKALDEILGLTFGFENETDLLAYCDKEGFLFGKKKCEDAAKDELRGHRAINPNILYSNNTRHNFPLECRNFMDRLETIKQMWRDLPPDEQREWIKLAYQNYLEDKHEKEDKMLAKIKKDKLPLAQKVKAASKNRKRYPCLRKKHLDGQNDTENESSKTPIEGEELEVCLKKEEELLAELANIVSKLSGNDKHIEKLRKKRKSITGRLRLARKSGKGESKTDSQLLEKSTVDIRDAYEEIELTRRRYKEQCKEIDKYRAEQNKLYGTEWHGKDIYHTLCFENQSLSGRKPSKRLSSRHADKKTSKTQKNPQIEIIDLSQIEKLQKSQESLEDLISLLDSKMEQPIFNLAFPFTVPDKILPQLMGKYGECVFIDGEKNYYENLLKLQYGHGDEAKTQQFHPITAPSPPLIRPAQCGRGDENITQQFYHLQNPSTFLLRPSQCGRGDESKTQQFNPLPPSSTPLIRPSQYGHGDESKTLQFHPRPHSSTPLIRPSQYGHDENTTQRFQPLQNSLTPLIRPSQCGDESKTQQFDPQTTFSSPLINPSHYVHESESKAQQFHPPMALSTHSIKPSQHRPVVESKAQQFQPLRIPSPPLIKPSEYSMEIYAEQTEDDRSDSEDVSQEDEFENEEIFASGEPFSNFLETGEDEMKVTLVLDSVSPNLDIENLVRQFAQFVNVDPPKYVYTQKRPNNDNITINKLEFENPVVLPRYPHNLKCQLCGKILSSLYFRSPSKWLTTFDEFGLFDEFSHFCSLKCYAMMCKRNNICPNFGELVEIDRSSPGGERVRRKSLETLKRVDNKDVQWKRYNVSSFTKHPSTCRKKVTTLEKQNVTICSSECCDLRKCLFCGKNGDFPSNGSGRLLYYKIEEWVHINCALWSNQVYETISGALINVDDALKKSRKQVCALCGQRGASLTCYRPRCCTNYHLECAKSVNCLFCPSKLFFCPHHHNDTVEEGLDDLSVLRPVYTSQSNNLDSSSLINVINRPLSNLNMRLGSLVVVSLGELFPQHIYGGKFNTCDFIYPCGYEAIRYCICPWDRSRRSKLWFSVSENDGKPLFTVEDRNDPQNFVRFCRQDTKALKSDIYGCDFPPFFDPVNDYFSHCVESVFGLANQNIRVIIESFPGVSCLSGYRFRHGKNHVSSLPLLYNESGCARTEGIDLNNLRRSLRQPKSEGQTAEDDKTSVKTMQSKQYQYRKMMVEGRKKNVYLGRSSIQGLGLFAAHDIEKGTVIVEYIGEIIREEVANRREKIYDANNRGVYMFCISDDYVIDASRSGGLARYANHSCRPNCTTEVICYEGRPKILIIAKQKISCGDEITYDYMFNDVRNVVPCTCMASNCKKWIC